MKRLFSNSLVFLLMIGSLSHIVAAAFCPRLLGRECCLSRAPNHTHASPSCHDEMTRHDMSMESMATDASDMPDMAMDGMNIDHMDMAMHDESEASGVADVSSTPLQPVAFDEVLASTVEQPFETCKHCLTHSGLLNGPVSFVRAPDQSSKDLGSVLLPVSKLFAASAITLLQLGLPREHAPPGSSAPRHLLLNIFLI
jgi:hypothetical protein